MTTNDRVQTPRWFGPPPIVSEYEEHQQNLVRAEIRRRAERSRYRSRTGLSGRPPAPSRMSRVSRWWRRFRAGWWPAQQGQLRSGQQQRGIPARTGGQLSVRALPLGSEFRRSQSR